MGFPQGHSLLSVIHHGLSCTAWGQLCHHDLLHRLQGNFSTWSPSFPSFLPGLAVCVLSHTLTLLFPDLYNFCVIILFFSHLKYVITGALLPTLMGLALARLRSDLNHLALAVRHDEIFFYRSHSGKLLQLAPVPKPGHENPIQSKIRIRNFCSEEPNFC